MNRYRIGFGPSDTDQTPLVTNNSVSQSQLISITSVQSQSRLASQHASLYAWRLAFYVVVDHRQLERVF